VQFEATVEVQLKAGIADPQGSTIENATLKLGFNGIENVRVGKSIRFAITADDEVKAKEIIQDLCDKFLTNPVIENATIHLQGVE
jgi:phosphoribosylformylglycinamidine synthase|tara:strand:+ start:26377 stop:26631 length:255 start_codon:yes stop_codon:yes gene_type:complete